MKMIRFLLGIGLLGAAAYHGMHDDLLMGIVLAFFAMAAFGVSSSSIDGDSNSDSDWGDGGDSGGDGGGGGD